VEVNEIHTSHHTYTHRETLVGQNLFPSHFQRCAVVQKWRSDETRDGLTSGRRVMNTLWFDADVERRYSHTNGSNLGTNASFWDQFLLLVIFPRRIWNGQTEFDRPWSWIPSIKASNCLCLAYTWSQSFNLPVRKVSWYNSSVLPVCQAEVA